jgi:hypothetical protein
MPEVTDLSQQHTKSETIKLGGFHLFDELNAPLVANFDERIKNVL